MKEILPVYETKLVRRGRRKPSPAIQTSQALYALVKPYFSTLDREHLVVLYLDTGLHPLGCKLESIGSASQCLADVRLIIRDALLANAGHLALAHNHPSGDLNPSVEDRALTLRLREAATSVGIVLIDHLIVTAEGFYSFADHGFFHPSTTPFPKRQGGALCA
jgi:DNA repair protein RadC